MGKKLKQGQKKFRFLGRVNMDSKGTNIRLNGVANSGFIYNSINLMLDVGNGNSVKVENFGGHFPKDHDKKTKIYLNKENWSDGQIELAFEDRDNETILKKLEPQISDSNYFKVGMEFGKGDKYPIIEKFLSEYDMIEYINEHLQDGDIISVSGSLEPNVYNGNVSKNYVIKYISKRKESVLKNKLDEGQKIEDLFYANFTETLYFTENSVGRKDRESGLIPVTGYSYDYLRQVDGNDFKKSKIIPVAYWIENQKMKKYLSPSRGKVNKLTVDGHIVNRSKQKKLNFEELDDDVKELVNDGLLTKEDAIGKATVYGGYESKRYIDTITIYTKEKDESVVQDVQYDKNFFDDDSVIYDALLDIDEPEEADLNEDYEGEDEEIIDSVSEKTDEDKELDDVLAGL